MQLFHKYKFPQLPTLLNDHDPSGYLVYYDLDFLNKSVDPLH